MLIHHPPQTRPEWRDRRLIDGDAFIALLRKHGAELVLHGHEHLDLVRKVQASKRQLLEGVKQVHVEGLAPSDRVVLEAIIRVQRKSPDEMTGLKIGAAGQLMVEKKLKVVPAEAGDGGVGETCGAGAASAVALTASAAEAPPTGRATKSGARAAASCRSRALRAGPASRASPVADWIALGRFFLLTLMPPV